MSTTGGDASAIALANIQERADYKVLLDAYTVWSEKDDLAYAEIVKMVDTTQDQHMKESMNAHELWVALETAHAGSYSGMAAFYVKVDMFDRKYTPGTSMADHLAFFETGNLRLTSAGEEFGDVLLAQLMLHSIPSSIETWNTVLTNILTNASSTFPLTSFDVKAKLLAAAQRLQRGHDADVALAAAAQAALISQPRPRNNNKSKVTCSYCKYTGHVEADCRRKKAAEEKSKEKKKPKAAATAASTSRRRQPSSDEYDSSDDEPATRTTGHFARTTVFLARIFDTEEPVVVSANIASYTRKDIVVDSGASRHLSPNEDWFDASTLSPLVAPIAITIANGVEIFAHQQGTLLYQVKGSDGEVSTGRFERALLVKELATTLISVKELTQGNHRVVFENRRCNIINKSTGLTAASARIDKSNLYQLSGSPISPAVAHVATKCVVSVDVNLLHDRLAHLGHQNVKKLIREHLVHGIDNITGTPQFCKSCVGGKQHRLPFHPRTALATSRKLELVHSHL